MGLYKMLIAWVMRGILGVWTVGHVAPLSKDGSVCGSHFGLPC